jgi:hypothetical protein
LKANTVVDAIRNAERQKSIFACTRREHRKEHPEQKLPGMATPQAPKTGRCNLGRGNTPEHRQ